MHGVFSRAALAASSIRLLERTRLCSFSRGAKSRRTDAAQPDGGDWTGRGGTPRWLTVAMEKGQKKDQFAV